MSISDPNCSRIGAPRRSHATRRHAKTTCRPLMVAAGAGGGDRGRRSFFDTIAGKACSGYRFG